MLTKRKYILAITDTQIVELYPHKFKPGVAIASEVHELQALSKLKFKKGEQGILLLEYKNGKVSKLLMDDPATCVERIKTRMTNMGINGSIKNKTERILENAQGFFKQAKEIETQFSLSPSVEYVQEMMDLLRKATEKFAEANDDSYMDVMDFIKRFLQRPDVNSVLDASVKTPAKTSTDAIHQTPQPGSAALVTGESTPSLLSPTTSQYLMSLPDIDAELTTLQNALTYHFEEDDHHHDTMLTALRHGATPASSSGSHASAAKKGTASSSSEREKEKCELTEMLDKMHLEFDSLLSSFGEESADPASGAEDKISVTAGDAKPSAELTDADLAGLMEMDFDQTLAEIVKL